MFLVDAVLIVMDEEFNAIYFYFEVQSVETSSTSDVTLVGLGVRFVTKTIELRSNRFPVN